MHVPNRAQLTRGVVALWPFALLCAVLGALLGGASQIGGTSRSAEAMVRLEQPASVSAVLSGQPTSTDELQSYVSGEIAYLSGSGFHNAVKAQLGSDSDPTISAVQNSNSAVVTISATSPDENEAMRAVDTAISTYLAHTSQELNDRNNAALDSINALINRQQAAGRTSGIQELRTQASALQLQMAAGATATVVQPATETSSGSSNWRITAAIGAIVGALVGLGGALVWRSRKKFISSPSDAEEVATTLTPVVATSGRSGVAPTEAEKDAARSMFAQLGSPRHGTIAVVGASADSGTRRVGELLAGAAANHAEVRVIECLPLGVDADLADHLKHADYIVVVVQQYVDRLPSLNSTLAIVPASTPAWVAVTRHRRRLRGHHEPTTTQPETSPTVIDGDEISVAASDDTNHGAAAANGDGPARGVAPVDESATEGLGDGFDPAGDGDVQSETDDTATHDDADREARDGGVDSEATTSGHDHRHVVSAESV